MANYSDVMEMCRLCLVKDQVNLPIFGGAGDIQQIYLKITACLPVKVSQEDNLPKSICDGCSYKLDLLYEFWNTSSNSEKQLIDWLTAAGVDPKQSAIEPIGVPVESAIILKQEPVGDVESAITTDAQTYLVQQQELTYKPEVYAETQPQSSQPVKGVKKKAAPIEAVEETPSKRPRRATRNTKSVREDSEDEDYVVKPEASITKTEGEIDEEDEDEDYDEDADGDDGGDDMGDPDFVAVDEDDPDGDDADDGDDIDDGDVDQPGPSGVSGKSSSAPLTAPVVDEYAHYKKLFGLKDCVVFLGKPSDFDNKMYRFMKTQAYAYCDVDKTNILPSPRLKYKCDMCTAKYRDHFRLLIHKEIEHNIKEDSSPAGSSNDETYVPDANIDAPASSDEGQTGKKKTVNSRKVAGAAKSGRATEGGGSRVKSEGAGATPKAAVVAPEIAKVPTIDLNSVAEVVTGASKKKKFRCSKCLRVFARKTELAVHLKEVHKVYACTLCPQAFYSKVNFDQHLTTKHYNVHARWRCQTCGISFLHYDNLMEHNFEKHKPQCKLCKRDFHDVQTLISHKVSRHSIPASIICEECGITTSDAADLKRHMDLHTNYSFQCELCDRSFESKKFLMTHMQGHYESEATAQSVIPPPPPEGDQIAGPASLVSAGSPAVPGMPRVLNHIQQLPSMKLPLPQLAPLTHASDAATVQVDVAGPSNQSEPVDGSDPSSAAVRDISRQKKTTTEPGANKEHKLLVIDKNTKQAYLVPAKMVNQNGQMKLQFKDHGPREPVALLPERIVPKATQPAKIVKRKAKLPKASPNLQLNLGKTEVKQYRAKKATQMPMPMTDSESVMTAMSSLVARSFWLAEPKPPESSNEVVDLDDSDRETVTVKVEPTIVAEILPESREASENSEIPTHSTPSLVPTEPVINMEVDTPSESVSMPEESAPRPKIFLKPLSQLLEKKVPETTTSAAEPPMPPLQPILTKPTTSGLTRITADKVPEYIKKVSAKLRTAAATKPAVTLPTNPTPVIAKSTSPLISKMRVQVQMKANQTLSIPGSSASSDEPTANNSADDTRFQCKKCGLKFNRLNKFALHLKKLQCKLCEFTVCKLKTLDMHYRSAHNFVNQCVTCDVQFDTGDLLKEHNKSVHLCVKCQKFYTSIEKHHSLHKCIKCNVYECTQKDLSRHYQTAHSIDHVCTPCKLMFSDQKVFMAHKKNSHYCAKCKSYKMDLKSHQTFCLVVHSATDSSS